MHGISKYTERLISTLGQMSGKLLTRVNKVRLGFYSTQILISSLYRFYYFSVLGSVKFK